MRPPALGQVVEIPTGGRARVVEVWSSSGPDPAPLVRLQALTRCPDPYGHQHHDKLPGRRWPVRWTPEWVRETATPMLF